MYDSRPRPAEGEPIEEVLPAAINATATSEKASRAGGELARRQSANAGQSPLSGSRSADESRMAVMRSGSTQWLRTPLPTGTVIAVGLALLVALVALLIVLI